MRRSRSGTGFDPEELELFTKTTGARDDCALQESFQADPRESNCLMARTPRFCCDALGPFMARNGRSMRADECLLLVEKRSCGGHRQRTGFV